MGILRFKKEFADKVFYDHSFQRRVVWKPAIFYRYMAAVSYGWKIHDIILADIAACRDFCKEAGDTKSYDYFDGLLNKGYRYISLDGQNRTVKLLEFFANKITITGEFMNADEELEQVENKHYKDLSPSLKAQFTYGCDIGVKVNKRATRPILANIFKAINSGCPLKHQEKRNSTSTPIAAWVRDKATSYRGMLQKVVKEDDQLRMGDDELIVKVALHLIGGYHSSVSKDDKKTLVDGNFSASTLDLFYDIGIPCSDLALSGCPYDDAQLHRAASVIGMVSSVIVNLSSSIVPPSKLVPLKTFWALVYYCELLYDEGYHTVTQSAGADSTYELVKDVCKGLYDKSVTDYANARAAKVEVGEDPEDVSDTDYYYRWCALPHIPGPRLRRRKALHEALQLHVRERENAAVRDVA